MGLPSVGLNTAFSVLSNVLGVRNDPYQGFNFMVEIEGILAGGFSECTGLQVETEFVDFREGGQNDFVHRFAGPTKYPSLLLKHGLTQIDGIWNWHQDVTQGKINRKNGTIYLLDKQRIPVMYWNFGSEQESEQPLISSGILILGTSGYSQRGARERLDQTAGVARLPREIGRAHV